MGRPLRSLGTDPIGPPSSTDAAREKRNTRNPASHAVAGRDLGVLFARARGDLDAHGERETLDRHRNT